MPITALRVDAVVVYTPDPARSRAFYQDLLGVVLEDRTSDPHDPHWGGFVQKMYFAIQERALRRGAEQRVGFSFEVDDLVAMVAKLRCARVPIVVEPSSRSYGRIAAVHDPDGNIVYLHELVPTPAPGEVRTAGAQAK